MRSLWTSASGMSGQQARLDAISQNLSNLNTTGYKKEDVQFRDMLYAQMTQKPDVAGLQNRQTTAGLRIGHGVLPVSTLQTFTQGELQQTNNNLDVAMEGDGFFTVGLTDPQGQLTKMLYTRDGSFKVGQDPNGNSWLVDSEGHAVLDDQQQPIDLTGYDASTLSIDEAGNVSAKQIGGSVQSLGTLGIVRVDHPDANLEAAGQNLFALRVTAPVTSVTYRVNIANGPVPNARQGFLEQSNVDMSQEMTDMLMAQRAYSMNVRALQTADQMMGIANNLRNG